jgi:hypothetical protein
MLHDIRVVTCVVSVDVVQSGGGRQVECRYKYSHIINDGSTHMPRSGGNLNNE